MINKNRFLVALSGSPRTDFGRVPFSQQSRPHQVFSAIWALESEVNSGGFLHYYTSDDEGAAVEAASALTAIGAHRAAAIVQEAVSLLSSAGVSAEGDSSQQLTPSQASRLTELDEAFMSYPDSLTELLFAYVGKHPEAFGEIGDGAV